MTRADTSVEIHDLIAERRSPRSLDATATIEDQDLLAMLEAARWAPSSTTCSPGNLLQASAVMRFLKLFLTA
jgi:nitroreductase